jgi:Transposase
VIADPAGKPIATMRIGNDSAGFARLLAAIAKTVPGPRVAVSVEGTRSYGIGLARALAAAGLLVIECERPSRKRRRGRGKSDPIDAHLAVLAALRLHVGKLAVPRADGDREALRILLVARQEIRVARTAQAARLRALLLAGEDTDRRAPATPSPRGRLPPWPGASCPPMLAASTPSATPGSAASRSRSARPGTSSRTTMPSCWPSSRTSPPALSAATGSGRSAPRRPS